VARAAAKSTWRPGHRSDHTGKDHPAALQAQGFSGGDARPRADALPTQPAIGRMAVKRRAE
jgi:hypothetical protein